MRVAPRRSAIARRHISIDISRPAFCALWWVLLCFMTINALFLGGIGALYLMYVDITSPLRNVAREFLFSRQMQFLEQYHTMIGIAYVGMALPFAVFATRMVTHTIIRRQLAFGPAHNLLPRTSNPRLPRRQRRPPIDLVRVLRLLARYSIGGKNFTSFIIVSETAEVFMQFCQGFQASKSISEPAFSQIYGTMILINCCSTPLIMYCCEKTRQSVQTENLLCAVTNSILAFTWGTVIQAWLIVRFVRYDLNQSWSKMVPETAERELGYLLVVSPMNFVFSTFTFITSGVVMVDCVRVLNHGTSRVPQKAALSPVLVTPIGRPRSESSPPTRRATFLSADRYGSFLRQWYAFMICFGMLVFVVAMGATGKIWHLRDSAVPCLDQIYPWLTSDVSCVGRKINCTQFHISGEKTELDAILKNVSTYLLSSFAIVDCPALEMPAAIQRFDQIETLSVLNSTMREWDISAAVDDLHFPVLKTLSLHSIDFATIPFGFVSQPLPASFEWMYADNINADLFVDLVGDNWSMMEYFQCRSCHLHRIPAMVHNMSKLLTARFENNNIRSVESNIFAGKPDLTFLSLNGNPLSELPASVWSMLCQLWWLEVEFTNVSTISEIGIAAAATNDIVIIRAAGSPLCTKNQTQALLPASNLVCTKYTKGW